MIDTYDCQITHRQTDRWKDSLYLETAFLVPCPGLPLVASSDSSRFPTISLLQLFLVYLTWGRVYVNIGWGFSKPHENIDHLFRLFILFDGTIKLHFTLRQIIVN